jgi:CubicO group peptidase (beta-lactamase class C family)
MMKLIKISLALIVCFNACSPVKPPVDKTLYKPPVQKSDSWQTGTLDSAGINGVKIEEMLSKIQNNTYKNIHAITLAKDGILIIDQFYKKELSKYDRYINNRDINLHAVMSVTKSLVSLLMGIAIDKNIIIGTEQKILPLFPEYTPVKNPNPLKDNQTIHNFLTMQHGLLWDEDSFSYDDPKNSYFQMSQSNDWVKFTLDLPLGSTPGTMFSYSSGITQVLSAAIEKQAGKNFIKFAEENLLLPLNIKKTAWFRSSEGRVEDIFLTCRAMLKIGQLVLNKGRWGNRQIISKKWVLQSTEQKVNLGDFGYGYFWWTHSFKIDQRIIKSILAWGFGGQFIFIFPDLNLTIAFSSGNYDSNELSRQPFTLLSRYILPAVLVNSAKSRLQ